MPGLVFYLFCMFIVAIARAIVRAARRKKPEPICTQCVFAHIQYTGKAQRAISCAYGGIVRPMTLDVLYCTDYRDRNVMVPLRAIGFAPDATLSEPMSDKIAARTYASDHTQATARSCQQGD
jgi:hypothetical protein